LPYKVQRSFWPLKYLTSYVGKIYPISIIGWVLKLFSRISSKLTHNKILTHGLQ